MPGKYGNDTLTDACPEDLPAQPDWLVTGFSLSTEEVFLELTQKIVQSGPIAFNHSMLQIFQNRLEFGKNTSQCWF